PATYEPILLLYGQLYPPLLIALLGALTSAAAEYLNYHLYRALLDCDSLDRVLRSDAARPITALFARRPFLAIWICAWSPLPDWAARILASHSRYSVRRYLTAFVAGRIPKFWLLAEVGLHWMPSGGTVLAIAAASTGLTLLGLRRRRRVVPATV
ncbi:MAG: VTT domain-containing protein, partial [Gemmatimonadales bacterium]